MKYDLSILIPARNEEFLKETIDDILKNIKGNTEIIVFLDGQWSQKPLTQHPRLTVIYFNKSIGQRAGTNKACKLSEAKYVMKVDAHCAFDEGFDVKLMADMQDDWTMAPLMKNLHAFNWVCENGHKRYQGGEGVCLECGKETKKEIVFKPRERTPNSTAYCFDTTLHFQYHNEWKKKQKGDLVESMSLQGSCFMLTREKYWDLNICDEAFGSWGQQGVEVACKTWLSGGKVIISKKTWYAHMFRTDKEKGFGFPYPLSGKDVEKARKYSRDLFINNNWNKQKYPLEWLINRFKEIPDWHFEWDKSPKNRIEVINKVKEEGAKFVV